MMNQKKPWHKRWLVRVIPVFLALSVLVFSGCDDGSEKIKVLESKNSQLREEINTLESKLEKYADLIALEEAKSEEEKLKAKEETKMELEKLEAEKEQLKWEEVFEFSGSTSKRSPLFTITSQEAKVVWEHNGNNHFSIWLTPEGSDYGDLLVNYIGATSDESYFYQVGTYYLDVEGSTPWEIKIVQNIDK
jgi:hypothetical protein